MKEAKNETETIKVPRKVDGIPYIGVIYTSWKQYCEQVRSKIEVVSDWTDDQIADNVFAGYQAGKHVHMGQQLAKKGELVEGMELEYVRLQGLRKSKWGALSPFIAQAKSDLKMAGKETTDENVRKLAEHRLAQSAERAAEVDALFN